MDEGIPSQKQRQPGAEAYESATLSRRKAIVVLGMHRSGTSALTGVVSACGAAGPKTLMGPSDDNARGYFESTPLSAAHDKVLVAAGSYWHDWRRFDLQWIHSKAAEQHRQNIKAILTQEFGDEPLIVIKDPRVCRFVPFTAAILNDMNVDLVAILPVRNPLEVAYSLQRRDEFALSKSILLWLRHVLDAEFYSRPLPRYFLRYEEFLSDWRLYLGRAADKIGIQWPVCRDNSDAKIDQFLAPELRHERVSPDEFRDHPDVTPWARETYDVLSELSASGESAELLAQLDRIRQEFDDACRHSL
jgi:hypothetical protein